MTLLVLSGITAFPVRWEVDYLDNNINVFPLFFQKWITELKNSIDNTPDVMLYGTDWLAFAHIIIALFFIPVFNDPVRHKANIIIGMSACLAIFPLAFICGPIRGIPFFHQLIDCCFGVGGFILLSRIYYSINLIEKRSLQ
jgi:hypothetical protein